MTMATHEQTSCKRALIIGSETAGLRGPHNDATAMAALLRGRGFEVDLRLDAAATRAGILAGYRQLIEQSAPPDAAVVYYAGHGAHATLAEAALSSWQHILPFDYRDSTADDWRGITAWELSLLQQELTGKTRNVTVILDCCHSEQMSRNAAAHGAVARAISQPNLRGFRRHIDELRARHAAAFAAQNPLGSLDAVRLVACAQTESAYEYAQASGVWRGVFTESLIAILTGAGSAPITWHAVTTAIRARVQHRFPAQRPDLEGPGRRLVFELTEHDDGGAVAIDHVDGQYLLSAGRLLGVQVGDVYGVMPPGALRYDEARRLGTVEVTEALAATSQVTAQGSGFPAGAIAFPVRKQARRRPVALDVPDADRPAITSAIAAAGTLCAAAPGDPEAVATLQLRDGQLVIAQDGGPLTRAVRYPDELATAVRHLANLGVAQTIRELEGSHGVAPDEVVIELGTVVNDALVPVPDGGALGLHDRIYVRLGTRAVRTLYFHVFSVGIDGHIVLLTRFAPSGLARRSGDGDYALAGAPGNHKGFALAWPPHMRTDVPRLDELLVIVTTRPVSLSALETRRVIGEARRGGSPLADVLAQVQDGESRNVAVPFGSEDGYLARRLAFVLHPREVAMAGLAFAIDENPTGLGGARAADAWHARGLEHGKRGEPAPQIAIRLGELTVLDNRALFRSDVRIDAVICTRSGTGKPVTWTERFSRIADGEQLPLRNAVLFLGPVRDFVDISLFVSRDAAGSLDLAALFEQQTASAEFKDAAAALLVAAGAVTAMPWVAAVGASAVLARMAYRLVLGVAGTSIGLYRTSFVAREGFGVGRHPVEGLYRAQDFAFALSVEPA